MTLSELLKRVAPGRRSTGAVRVVFNGTVIAESVETIRLEGNHYFPRESVRDEYLVASSHTSVCPWKGTARYLTVEVDGRRDEDAAWYYPSPSAAAAKIRDHVAFGHGVGVERP